MGRTRRPRRSRDFNMREGGREGGVSEQVMGKGEREVMGHISVCM